MMGEIIVKDSVRYTKKDANRVDVVTAGTAVQTKVPVEDTDAWAQAEAEKARAELQAELDATRAKHESDLAAELDQRRADFERELEERRNAPIETPPTGDTPDATAASPVTEEIEEEATKAVDPEVTKVREPDTAKSGRGRKSDSTK